ncbi:hypothetical protein ACOZ35_06725 [Halorubrum xinjiangense]|uniref:hypothetical protein n=1 Tax=Halorubrum xinjiangense TaxID=261291 RepID=UPI003C6F8671
MVRRRQMILPPKNNSRAQYLLPIGVVIVFTILCILAITSIGYYYNYIESETINLIISSTGTIATLLFFIATILTVRQNRRSILRAEKEQSKPLVRGTVEEILQPIIATLVHNQNELKKGCRISFRSHGTEAYYDLTDPLRPIAKENKKSHLTMDGSKELPEIEPIYYSIFAERCGEATSKVENYNTKVQRLEEATEEVGDSIEDSGKTWFTICQSTLFCRRLLILLSCRCGVEEDKDTASAVSDTNDSAGCVWVGIGRSGPVTAGSLA